MTHSLQLPLSCFSHLTHFLRISCFFYLFFFSCCLQLPVADPFLDKLDFGDLGKNRIYS